ncbi:aminotransferase class I/II-fold pyridoxal phosphate-dependent enzyme [Francisellaceae bacterium]|nr:aminotransferase class I/II-fold pyridoxal phosphate-dependent enzyme [Francisellaceae bacterium]
MIDDLDYKLINTPFSDTRHASSPPIYQTVTHNVDIEGDEHSQYLYSRLANPTTDILAKQLALLDEAKYCFPVSSGLTAINLVFSLLNENDSIVIGEDIYGGTDKIIEYYKQYKNLNVFTVDTTNLTELEDCLKENTVRFVWLETPSNPLQIISDIQAIADLAKQYNSLLVVDNSFLSSYLQKPLSYGADISLQSLTKHIGGFSDVIGGCIATNDKKLGHQLKQLVINDGSLLAPHSAWLFLRSLKTLSLRIRQQQASAEFIAEYLDQHDLVKACFYPSLDSKHNRIHTSQASGFGSVVSFVPNSYEMAVNIIHQSKDVMKVTASFGSASTTISMPSLMSHRKIFTTRSRSQPFDPALIRLSVGIEDPEVIKKMLQNVLR